MATTLPQLGGGSGGAHNQPSLPLLPAHLQSDTHITGHLASRFHVSLPTAKLSSHGLICLNTYTSSTKGPDGGKAGSAMAGAEDMADRAWLRLGHRSESQVIVFLGESGSGKSTTATTPTASKSGLFYELQYDTSSTTNPVLIGGKVLDHRLERSRIADVPTGERNFHILYYLLAGTSEAEKTHLGLDSSKRWKYLGHPTQLKVGINDAEGFQLFKSALRKLEFPRSEIAESTSNTSATGDDSGGFSHEGGVVTTTVKNKDVLGIVAAFLGVSAGDLQGTLGYKTKMIQKERVTVMLDPNGARAHANELARTLYALLVAWIIENANQRICAPDESIANTISLVDFPGFAQQSSTRSTLDQLLNNAATEAIYNMTLHNFFDRKADMLESEEGLLKPGNGLLSILDDQTRRNRTDMQLLESFRKRFEGKNPAIEVGAAVAKLPGSNFLTENTAASFTVKHFAGEVDYPVKGLIEENGEVISDALRTIAHPKERTAVLQASAAGRGKPNDSDKHSKSPLSPKGGAKGVTEQGASGQFLSSLDNVHKAVTDPGTNGYFVFCLKPNDRRIANQFDSNQRLRSADFSLERERAEVVIDEKRWPSNEEIAHLPTGRIGTGSEGEGGRLSPGDAGKNGYFGGSDDTRSEAGASALGAGDMFKNLDTREQMAERGNEKSLVEVEEFKDSASRKRWVFTVYLLTWLVPDFLIRWLAINMLIWLLCLVAAFFIVVLPILICPKQNVYSAEELSAYDGKDGSKGAYVSIRGYVIDVGSFAPHHYPPYVESKNLLNYAGKDGASGSPSLINSVDMNAKYHDFRFFTNDSRPDWYRERLLTMRGNWGKGNIGYSPQYVKKLAEKQQTIGILGHRVYDLTTYLNGGRKMRAKAGEKPPSDATLTDFMDPAVVQLFQLKAGSDTCLDYLFYVGDVDTRRSTRCQFAEYLFGGKNVPEKLDKFVLCQIPAYTEDEESLRRAIDSAARMHYDDKRKLLVIICDGMIIGQGNDRATPRISLGEGQKQHNMGKVYSGLYEVGKPSEVVRPGNRGKRDSQMVVMRFLNRIRNIIGVNPTFYEFMLQIDADTVVAPDSATRMVSAFLDDTRLIAVYEYYISHNLSKAFESLFGSVTCLPGCFSMYRIRAAETGKPLFVSREVVESYATIRVDTLHMKNLLHLGEDRYLTTLLLKYHSRYKTKYIFTAHAWTIAPDSWHVFLSQRRRWINSTVHNLIELIPMNQLCGFCCFSMRFIVFIDLLSTLVQPVTIAYIVYLIVLVATKKTVVPLTAFVLLGAIYGLQAIIFILRRKWEMVGWMILYVLAIPVFSFGLPLYAFWHMDDFNWGNTRVVAGEKGKKLVISDEGKFDPSSIPRKKWEEYQAELWETQTSRDDSRSELSALSYGTKAQAAVSEYAFPSRPDSTTGFAPPPPPPLQAQQQQQQQQQQYLPGHYAFDARNASRMSLAPSEMMMMPPPARASQHGGSQLFNPDDMVGLPSDDGLLAEIRDILRTADLMTVTKKGVKQELERRFDVPLDSKRAYINSATEAILSGQL
ncbi:hypothetical protein CDD81_7314 [Ophiocordyceps australis]|uniref:chitin synthase n=1 Tax=Ophiocordyceps australis TaxID=1399860 RepID=A0A2C5Y5L0_9HYPO|nr:hypothetical protein CDD81_7314 [Ophiocordyceps australis]